MEAARAAAKGSTGGLVLKEGRGALVKEGLAEEEGEAEKEGIAESGGKGGMLLSGGPHARGWA